MEKRVCPVTGEKVNVILSANVNKNVGLICFCIDECPHDNPRCLFQLSEETK